MFLAGGLVCGLTKNSPMQESDTFYYTRRHLKSFGVKFEQLTRENLSEILAEWKSNFDNTGPSILAT